MDKLDGVTPYVSIGILLELEHDRRCRKEILKAWESAIPKLQVPVNSKKFIVFGTSGETIPPEKFMEDFKNLFFNLDYDEEN